MIITVSSNDSSLNWTATGNERIVQNVLNIIRTRTYEVPFMRDLGINEDYIDSRHGEMNTDFIGHVTEVINEYEPRANVVDARVSSCDENGDYIISVDLEV